jgi:hypothetical protein
VIRTRNGVFYTDDLSLAYAFRYLIAGKAQTLEEALWMMPGLHHYPSGLTLTGMAGTPQNEGNVDSWPTLNDQAFYGIFGKIVRLIEPHSEADPAAILFQLLTGFGNAVGAGPFYLADGSRHYANLFGCLVGQSSRSRKGTSWNHAQRALEIADPDWNKHHHNSGLSSGEGLIWKVRDPVIEYDRKKKQYVVTDPGVADKRLQVNEHEFARVLQVMNREGNTLSEIVRCAWDHRNLETMTRNSPAIATDPHISIIGHITR